MSYLGAFFLAALRAIKNCNPNNIEIPHKSHVNDEILYCHAKCQKADMDLIRMQSCLYFYLLFISLYHVLIDF